jgi:hypothetical protein
VLGAIVLVTVGTIAANSIPQPAKSFGLVLVRSIRPKGPILGAAASLALRDARLNVEETDVLVVVHSAPATSAVTSSIVATLVMLVIGGIIVGAGVIRL